MRNPRDRALKFDRDCVAELFLESLGQIGHLRVGEIDARNNDLAARERGMLGQRISHFAGHILAEQFCGDGLDFLGNRRGHADDVQRIDNRRRDVLENVILNRHKRTRRLIDPSGIAVGQCIVGTQCPSIVDLLCKLALS